MGKNLHLIIIQLLKAKLNMKKQFASVDLLIVKEDIFSFKQIRIIKQLLRSIIDSLTEIIFSGLHARNLL